MKLRPAGLHRLPNSIDNTMELIVTRRQCLLACGASLATSAVAFFIARGMSWVPLGEDELGKGRGSATLEANLNTHDRQVTPLQLLRFARHKLVNVIVSDVHFDYRVGQ